MNVRNNKMNVRKLEGVNISASEKNITKCTHTVYNVTCFTSLIYTNFNGRICLELVKLLKLTGAVLQISIKIML